MKIRTYNSSQQNQNLVQEKKTTIPTSKAQRKVSWLSIKSLWIASGLVSIGIIYYFIYLKNSSKSLQKDFVLEHLKRKRKIACFDEIGELDTYEKIRKAYKCLGGEKYFELNKDAFNIETLQTIINYNRIFLDDSFLKMKNCVEIFKKNAELFSQVAKKLGNPRIAQKSFDSCLNKNESAWKFFIKLIEEKCASKVEIAHKLNNECTLTHSNPEIWGKIIYTNRFDN